MIGNHMPKNKSKPAPLTSNERAELIRLRELHATAAPARMGPTPRGGETSVPSGLRLTPTELALYDQLAKARGKSRSAWLRDSARAAALKQNHAATVAALGEDA